jgi:hypothetical protein
MDKNPDLTLNFTADVGTACHKFIQENLIELYKDNWISVEDYLREKNPDYEYTVTQSGFETQVEITDPPIKFACDGILRIGNKYYLLEIKTASYSSFDQLTGPKDQHIDQVKCYATLLDIPNVLMLYVDREYGSMKCFELTVSWDEMQEVKAMFAEVQQLANAMIAPPKLPKNDSWCTASHCLYYKKCQEW